MKHKLPNMLTLFRVLLVPVLVLVYYLPFHWTYTLAAVIFVVAALTDWLDGYLARRFNSDSAFGAFLDPVADKLIVTTALVLLATDDNMLSKVFDRTVFAIVVAIIIGREIVVSALREWMAELGSRGKVAVGWVGKLKTTFQMVAITILLLLDVALPEWVFRVGEIMLLAAAILTMWSMVIYLKAAWPDLTADEPGAEG